MHHKDRAARRRRQESGSVTVEVAVLFPALLVLTMLIIQAALFWHAEQAALSAAQQGLAVARSQGIPAGVARATAVVGVLGGVDSASSSGRAGPELSVVVSGTAPSVVPGLSLRVFQAAAGPPESFGGP